MNGHLPRLSYSFFHVCEALKLKAKRGCCAVHRQEAQLGFELLYGLASVEYKSSAERLLNLELGYKGKLN